MSDNDLLLLYVIISIIAIIAIIFITRAVFSIPKFLNMKEAELKILSEIALKNGVEQEKITKIYKQHELP